MGSGRCSGRGNRYLHPHGGFERTKVAATVEVYLFRRGIRSRSIRTGMEGPYHNDERVVDGVSLMTPRKPRQEGSRQAEKAYLPGTRMVGSRVSFQLKLVTYSTFSILILLSKSSVNAGAAAILSRCVCECSGFGRDAAGVRRKLWPPGAPR